MRCPECGEDFAGVIHTCTRPRAATQQVQAEQDELESPARRHTNPLVRYLAEGWSIARWDDAAVRRAVRDGDALWYGLAFWIFGYFLAFLPFLAPVLAADVAQGVMFAVGAVILLPFEVLIFFLYYGACHLAARLLFQGEGAFFPLLRPLLLASIVRWVAVVPLVGPVIAGLWTMAVVMVVFEEVHRISRLKAFAIAYVLGLPLFVLRVWLSSLG